MDAYSARPTPAILHDGSAWRRLRKEDVTALTEAATRKAFYRDGLTDEQIAENRRVVEISASCCEAAARNAHQRFSAAFVGETFAGYMIATRHGPDDLELDWLMIAPAFHGSGVAGALMAAGLDWLGADRPVWLNVIAYNQRAIHFYRKFGFEIDPEAKASRLVPNLIMRRPPDGS
ncbi:GNAT family N-acetyltransferase [Amphiplicatus metriothermophilus]|uniref:Ribosomal protein S18 acetylase RimI n=1 Tax=Amphiplicatus metriothermophilus TaxID=1519374 RepID=A0A239PK85_9PROT|nr:GNAT family N-acetyltransferase [Amphiplicatus metriothermophilus]MBB5517459.1 ribosomal protein S18 acetylase RimI-like enzyme [Amphiplicatus metriothermophilus]SNT68206.1 Ribosomal protein S18 acetylase RimI [Amphiplicatus metriothermophilus]